MRRPWIAWTLAGLLAVSASAFAYLFWFAGGSGEPSTELTTPELSDTTSPTEGSAASTTDRGSQTSYIIDPTQSTAGFQIEEELQGRPNQVTGLTDQVAGQVKVDPSDLSTTQFSDIVVNARTFVTDSERRDRAIRGPVILDSASDEHELITLEVTSVDGLAGSANVGDTVDFSLTGDLTIKGTTSPVTFAVSVIFVDEGTIQGTATAEVTRSQFGIGIPSVPGVANVADDVLLRLEFVATAG
jgi:polyisoprenoid-binding protein YceI